MDLIMFTFDSVGVVANVGCSVVMCWKVSKQILGSEKKTDGCRTSTFFLGSEVCASV